MAERRKCIARSSCFHYHMSIHKRVDMVQDISKFGENRSRHEACRMQQGFGKLYASDLLCSSWSGPIYDSGLRSMSLLLLKPGVEQLYSWQQWAAWSQSLVARRDGIASDTVLCIQYKSCALRRTVWAWQLYISDVAYLWYVGGLKLRCCDTELMNCIISSYIPVVHQKNTISQERYGRILQSEVSSQQGTHNARKHTSDISQILSPTSTFPLHTIINPIHVLVHRTFYLKCTQSVSLTHHQYLVTNSHKTAHSRLPKTQIPQNIHPRNAPSESTRLMSTLGQAG